MTIKSKALVAALVLAGFGAYSVWVILDQGYTGFLTLAGREPWGLQLLLDLVIALSFTLGWLRADARKHGLAAWPFIVGAVFGGSIALLAYVAIRGLVATASTAAPAAAAAPSGLPPRPRAA